jgi:cytoskeletal protein CcmA (bactofilin family)
MWNRDTTQDEGPRMPQTSAAAAAAAVAAPSRASDERRVVAWVGKSILFRGDLIGLEDMSIDGRVEGTIELRDHNLTIGPDAHIQADIVAKIVTVNGAVVGTITASEAVHIGETGSVEGNITSRRVAMADGAVVKGHVNTGGNRGSAETGTEKQLKAVG